MGSHCFFCFLGTFSGNDTEPRSCIPSTHDTIYCLPTRTTLRQCLNSIFMAFASTLWHQSQTQQCMSGDAAPLFCSFVVLSLQAFLINTKSIINELTFATVALSAPHARMLIQLPTNSNRHTKPQEQAHSPSRLSCEVPPPSALCSRSPLLPLCKRVGQGGERRAFENYPYPLPPSLPPSPLPPPLLLFLERRNCVMEKKDVLWGPRTPNNPARACPWKAL